MAIQTYESLFLPRIALLQCKIEHFIPKCMIICKGSTVCKSACQTHKRNTTTLCLINILQIEVITKYKVMSYIHVCEKLSSIEWRATHFSRPTLLWVHYQYLYVYTCCIGWKKLMLFNRSQNVYIYIYI